MSSPPVLGKGDLENAPPHFLLGLKSIISPFQYLNLIRREGKEPIDRIFKGRSPGARAAVTGEADIWKDKSRRPGPGHLASVFCSSPCVYSPTANANWSQVLL